MEMANCESTYERKVVKMTLEFCFICASPCQLPQQLVSEDVTVKQERMEDKDNPFMAADLDHQHGIVEEEHLKPFFVLNTILKVPAQVLDEVNCGENSEQDPLSGIGTRIPLCPACGERARQFHEAFEQISRLQVILNEIQTEFLETILRDKDVQCQVLGPISNLERIRSKILLDSPTIGGGAAAHPVEFEAEDNDHFSEEWHFGNAVVKSQVADEHDDDEYEEEHEDNAFAVPTFTFSSHAFLEETTTSINDDGHFPVESLVPQSSKRRKVSSCGFQKTKTAQPAPVILQCALCPHKTTVISTDKLHQTVHQEGSGATACGRCGIFVLPNGSIVHGLYCAPAIRNSLGKDEKVTRSKGKIRNENHSNPGFISFNRALSKNKHYQCRRCPYETFQRWRMEVHVELHEEDSNAASCDECGWFLPPEQLETHRAVNHSITEKPSQPTTPAPKVKCGECSFECSSRYRNQFAYHAKGHQRKEIKCKDCGCWLARGQLGYHRDKYCLAR